MTDNKTKVTRVAFVLDRSGSMGHVMNKALDALDDSIDTIRKSTEEEGQSATVTVVVFDDQIDTLVVNRPVRDMGPVQRIRARNSTALRDAVKVAVDALTAAPAGQDEDVAYLVNVITDGMDNRSRMSERSFADMLQKHQATDRWTFAFLVPPGYTSYAVDAGVPRGNVQEWETSAQGVDQYRKATTLSLGTYFGDRSKGATRSTSFYTTNMTNVAVADVRALDDVTSKGAVLEVGNRDASSRDFVEEKGLRFHTGCIFYPLTKSEKIQGYKKIIVTEKGKTELYGGKQARALLGLPDHELRVRPGDHANFDIYVQSTSTNRKLLAGTKVVYMPGA